MLDSLISEVGTLLVVGYEIITSTFAKQVVVAFGLLNLYFFIIRGLNKLDGICKALDEIRDEVGSISQHIENNERNKYDPGNEYSCIEGDP